MAEADINSAELDSESDNVSSGEKHSINVGLNSRRSASPGVAKRVIQHDSTPAAVETAGNNTNSNPKPSTDNAIDDLTQKMANSLLESSSNKSAKTEYISINQKLDEKRQQDLVTQLSKQEVMLPQSLVSKDIPAVHSSSSHTSLNNSGSNGYADNILITNSTHNGITAQTNSITRNPLSSNSAAEISLMDASVLNIHKVVSDASQTPSIQTPWSNSNGVVDHAGPNTQPSNEEVDILTAMSGEPTPNSLPVVTDGISDGEISSDSDSEELSQPQANFQVR